MVSTKLISFCEAAFASINLIGNIVSVQLPKTDHGKAAAQQINDSLLIIASPLTELRQE